VARLIARCLLDDPDARPTARELVGLLAQAAQEGSQATRARDRRLSSVGIAVSPFRLSSDSLGSGLACNMLGPKHAVTEPARRHAHRAARLHVHTGSFAVTLRA